MATIKLMGKLHNNNKKIHKPTHTVTRFFSMNMAQNSMKSFQSEHLMQGEGPSLGAATLYRYLCATSHFNCATALSWALPTLWC